LWPSIGGFQEVARALYEIKMERPDLRIVDMAGLILPEMVSGRTA